MLMDQKDHYLNKINKQVIGLIKNKLGMKITTEFASLRLKTHSYLANNNHENRKAKGT